MLPVEQPIIIVQSLHYLNGSKRPAVNFLSRLRNSNDDIRTVFKDVEKPFLWLLTAFESILVALLKLAQLPVVFLIDQGIRHSNKK